MGSPEAVVRCSEPSEADPTAHDISSFHVVMVSLMSSQNIHMAVELILYNGRLAHALKPAQGGSLTTRGWC